MFQLDAVKISLENNPVRISFPSTPFNFSCFSLCLISFLLVVICFSCCCRPCCISPTGQDEQELNTHRLTTNQRFVNEKEFLFKRTTTFSIFISVFHVLFLSFLPFSFSRIPHIYILFIALFLLFIQSASSLDFVRARARARVCVCVCV